jgi:hypothetical protein
MSQHVNSDNIERDIAYLKLILGSTKISNKEDMEIREEICMLEEKKKISDKWLNLKLLGVSLYGSYFSSDIKID